MERKSEVGFSLLSFGGFLVIVGFTLYLYPEMFTEIRSFFETLVEQQTFSPSVKLLEASSLVVISLGVLNFILAAMRLSRGHPWQKPLQDTSLGITLVFLGYLIVLYAQGNISGRLVLPLFIILAGILIVANALLHHYFAQSN
jgi:VIT1/CCC1 family predicted Fe2+/Mn2+ transporter